MKNDSLDSAGSVVKPPAVAARSILGPVGSAKINSKKANPNVQGKDALIVVNTQSLTSATCRRQVSRGALAAHSTGRRVKAKGTGSCARMEKV